MNQPDDDDELLRLVSEAFDEGIGDPPDDLTEAARALMRRRPRSDTDAGAGPDDEVAAWRAHRLDRHLATAAAYAGRRPSATLTSEEGSIVTEVSENDEGRLQVTIRSTDLSLLYVELAWTPVTADGGGRWRRLVTPLAPDRQGLSVCYDLGPLDGYDAVEVTPAEAMLVSDVGPEDAALGLGLATTGASRRAWARAEEIHRANGDPLADVIARGSAG